MGGVERPARLNKVLVVDDEPGITEAICWGLEEQGFDVKRASDGVEALKLYEEHLPGIVITDIQMPNLSGDEFIKKLNQRSNPPLMVCMSGFTDFSLADAYENGALAFLSKPFTIRELTTALNRFIDIHKTLFESRCQAASFKEEAEKYKGLSLLAASIAHEIKNPLAIISARTQNVEAIVAQESISALNEKELSDNLKSIDNMTERLLAICNSMRNLSRNESSLKPEPTTVACLLASALVCCDDELKNSCVDFRIDESVNDAPEFLSSPIETTQILVNLIVNACQAVADLNEKWISVKAVVDGGDLLIMVTDSGKGIAPQHRNMLFKPFFSTKTDTVGTGIGLALSREIAQRQKGALYLDYESKNTCFVLKLPLALRMRRLLQANVA